MKHFCLENNSPRPPAPPIPPRVREHKHSEVSGKELHTSQSLPPPAPASEDLPPWHDAACPQALAATAMQAIHQLNALNVENGPGPAEPADLTHALESDQNFPEPTPSGVLPLRAAAGAVVCEPPDPQGFHPAIDCQALLGCLLHSSGLRSPRVPTSSSWSLIVAASCPSHTFPSLYGILLPECSGRVRTKKSGFPSL